MGKAYAQAVLAGFKSRVALEATDCKTLEPNGVWRPAQKRSFAAIKALRTDGPGDIGAGILDEAVSRLKGIASNCWGSV